MMSYNDRKRTLSESSESDIQTSNNRFKITSNPAKPAQGIRHCKYNESSESDISSLSEDQHQEDQIQRLRPNNNKKTIEIDRSDESSDDEASSSSSGIDIIEQRIKRLEVDLQAKIEKQKNSTISHKVDPHNVISQNKKYQGQLFKNQVLSNPPLPPSHKPDNKHNSSIPRKPDTILSYSQSQNLNQLNMVQKEVCLKETTKVRKVQQQIENQEHTEGEEPAKKPSLRKQIFEKPSPNKKSRISSKNSKSKQMNPATLLNKAHRQIDQMQKVIDDLKKENEMLKQQLGKSKKKHSSQQIQKLRKLSSGTGDLKLQKQIETLKAIQSLESKLKKSIAKKLKNQRVKSKNSGIAEQV